MRRSLLLVLPLAVAGVVALVAAIAWTLRGPAEPVTRMAPGRAIYVSLGDSLAVGYQPGAVDGGEGYAEQLLELRRAETRGLELVQLGCSGESTATMRDGRGLCRYEEGSQLAHAAAFLREHRDRVAFVTLSIGANDVLPCRSADAACVERGLGRIEENLPSILRTLRDAAGPEVPLVGATYYAPGLAAWLRGSDGEARARRYLERVVAPGNELLRSVYRAAGAAVADVDRAFSTSDSALTGTLSGSSDPVPENVAAICRLTWMCSRGDLHPNAEGYGEIARAFDAALP